MVLAKVNKFLYLFMLSKTGQEKEFCNFLDRKLAFLDYKNMDEKKMSQNGSFFKGVSPLFRPNFLDRKLAFLDYKNNDLKKSKNLHFSEGVREWFWPKL